MIKNALFTTLLVLLILAGSVWSDCPEESYDRGICDTMYVEAWPEDIPTQGEPPYFIRVAIYVTCDVVNELDSINTFVIPLCYEHTEPSSYCSVSTYWNQTTCDVNSSKITRSIFRDLPDMDNPTVFNRMLSMARDESERDWDTMTLNLDGTSHFWLNLLPMGESDQMWWEGSRILLATITFKVERDMEICIDTCLWTPYSHLAWGILDDDGYGRTKIPRSGTETAIYGGCFFTSEVREVGHSEESRPSAFSLSQNYPNPFNPVTNFEFSLSRSAHVKIDIFNVLGQKVKTLVNEQMNPGVYLLDWNGTDDDDNQVSSGVYFYRMQAGDFSEMKKMVLLK
jgi:hypothetical protein